MEEIRNKNGLTESHFLEQYKPGDYQRPSLTVDMLLFTLANVPSEDIRKADSKELKVLLIKRGDFPFLNHWALPGGFVGIDEGIRDAAYRELKEETNVAGECVYLEQLYTFGDNPKRDPRMRVISSAYIALVPQHLVQTTKAGDDASDARWFTVQELPMPKENDIERMHRLVFFNDEINVKIEYVFREVWNTSTLQREMVFVKSLSDEKLAFDHYDIIQLGLTRLKNKVEYTPIAFKLLPEKFTLKELHDVYEILLNQKLDKANFRRNIAPMLVRLDETESSTVGYRPARLYKYNPSWQKELLEEE